MVPHSPAIPRREFGGPQVVERSREELELAEQLLNHSQAGRIGPRTGDVNPSYRAVSPQEQPQSTEAPIYQDQDSSSIDNVQIPYNNDNADTPASSQSVTGQVCR